MHDLRLYFNWSVWSYRYCIVESKYFSVSRSGEYFDFQIIWNEILGNTASKVWKQQSQFYWVCSWEIMADTTSLTPPRHGLNATLLSNTSWTLQSQRTENVKITTLYPCTGRLLGPPHCTTTVVEITKSSQSTMTLIRTYDINDCSAVLKQLTFFH